MIVLICPFCRVLFIQKAYEGEVCEYCNIGVIVSYEEYMETMNRLQEDDDDQYSREPAS